MKILIIIALAIAAFLVIGRMRANSGSTAKKPPAKTIKAKKRTAPPAAQQHPFRATSIVLGESPCEAVRALAEKPYLDKDRNTPLLPLADCTAARCTCKYAHQQDRRDMDEDRRFTSSLQSEIYSTSDNESRRIKRRGRRDYDAD
jgi:hypothetical protein